MFFDISPLHLGKVLWYTQPIFINSAIKRAVRTSIWLWCQNFTARSPAQPTQTHCPDGLQLVPCGWSACQKRLIFRQEAEHKTPGYFRRAHYLPQLQHIPEKSIDDQGVPSNTYCSNHQDKEGNDVVSVVLNIHPPIESVLHIHFCDNHTHTHTHTSVSVDQNLSLCTVCPSGFDTKSIFISVNVCRHKYINNMLQHTAGVCNHASLFSSFMSIFSDMLYSLMIFSISLQRIWLGIVWDWNGASILFLTSTFSTLHFSRLKWPLKVFQFTLSLKSECAYYLYLPVYRFRRIMNISTFLISIIHACKLWNRLATY